MNSNAERFTGFADIYDQARPHLPAFPREVIRRYLGHAPDTVVDLGCGTGLSTAAWIGECRQVIGIEPSADMLGIAQKKAGEGIRFRQAFAHDTGLADGIADAIVCSQSFHWMEPVSTLREVHRLLAPGGVFATVDCDWPPMCGYEAEKAYQALFAQVRDIETGHPDIRSTFTRWEKEKHLQNIRECGCFAFVRELVFANPEACDAQRFIQHALSQGSLQAILKRHPELIENALEHFKQMILAHFGDGKRTIYFGYRMRVGVKGNE